MPTRIPVDTPIFVRDIDRWVPGRIAPNPTGLGDRHYRVDLPGGAQGTFAEDVVEVRCFDVNRDLGAMLGALVLDEAAVFDRRLRTTQMLTQMRGVSSGLGALMSASAELLPHQVEVVARVGSDPIIRYLLSDEVGLGKTVEAGAIVLELLRQDRDATAVVVTPVHLVAQWRQELEVRFSSDDVGGRLKVESYEWLMRDQPTPTVFVVDEAHTVVSKPGMEKAFRRVQHLAREARALLLLTATPVMANNRATIRLLHLVDPINYPIGDVDRFRFLMERRSDVQSALLTLSGGDSGFEARESAAAVERALPNDSGAMELATALRDSAATNVPSSIHEARLGLREYLSDGYRLYHRMLRTRRRDLREAGYFYRSGRVDVEWDVSPSARAQAAALEDWRYESLRSLDNQTDGPERDRNLHLLAWRYCRLAETLGSGSSDPADSIGSQRSAVAAGQLPTFPRDSGILARLAYQVMDGHVIESMAASIRQALAVEVAKGTRAPKMVAFSSSSEIARSLEFQFRGSDTSIAAFAITAQTTVRDSRRVIGEFRDTQGPAVLVCDQAGEIGLNLQFATVILHLDLPFSVMRMEQRIGRLDRIGRTLKSFDHRVYLPASPDSGPWFAWLHALRDGFRVFDESVADLSVISATTEKMLQLRLYITGGLSEPDIAATQSRVAEERLALDRRYLLERLELSDSNAVTRIREVVAADEEGTLLADLIRSWWTNEGGLVFRPADRSRTFEVLRRQDVRPAPRDVRAAIGSTFGTRHSFWRTEALTGAPVRLVRPGHPLVDALPKLMDAVSSGKTFALWRHVPAWAGEHGEWLIIRLAYIIEAPPDRLLDGRRHIGDGYVKPWVEVIHLDGRLERVSNPHRLSLAGAPFGTVGGQVGRDYDGRGYSDAIASRIGESVLESLCADAAKKGAQCLAADPAYSARVQAAIGAARARIHAARMRLERHQTGLVASGGSPGSTKRDLDSLRALEDHVLELSPRLDSMGLVILAGTAP